MLLLNPQKFSKFDASKNESIFLFGKKPKDPLKMCKSKCEKKLSKNGMCALFYFYEL